MPFAGAGIAFHEFAGGPVAVLGLCEHGQIDVGLAITRSDIAGTLGDHRPGFVVIGLVQKAATRIDVPPKVTRVTDLSLSWSESFWIRRLRYAIAPS